MSNEQIVGNFCDHCKIAWLSDKKESITCEKCKNSFCKSCMDELHPQKEWLGEHGMVLSKCCPICNPDKVEEWKTRPPADIYHSPQGKILREAFSKNRDVMSHIMLEMSNESVKNEPKPPPQEVKKDVVLERILNEWEASNKFKDTIEAPKFKDTIKDFLSETDYKLYKENEDRRNKKRKMGME